MSVHIPQQPSIFAGKILKQASLDAAKKLDPRVLWRNPVMFAVEIASSITLIAFVMPHIGEGREPVWFTGLVSLFLWLTVFFFHICRGIGRGTGQSPRRNAPQCAH